MSAVIQAIIATTGGGAGAPPPPPPTALDASFYGDDTIRGNGGQNGWWQVNSGWYGFSTFSGSLAWNAITYKDGTSGHTYDFTNGDYMIGPNLATSGYWASNTISINFWFYPTVNGVQLLHELGQADISNGYFATLLEITSMSNVKARFWQDSSPGDVITSVNTVNLNSWNHIYFTEDGQGGHSFELNGVPTNGNPVYTRSKPTPVYPNIHYAIGGVNNQNMGNTGAFQGKIGWLEIHDYVVSSTYQATKGTFVDPVVILNLDAANPLSYGGTGTAWTSVGSATQATLVGGPTYYNTGGVKAIAFTGGSYATVPADVWFDQDFTIVAWVKLNSITTWARIIDFGNGEDSNNVLFAFQGSTGYLNLRTENTEVTTTWAPSTGVWYHFAASVKANGSGAIFVNGELMANQGMTIPPSVTRNNCYIGKSEWAADSPLDGLIGELRIYRGALTDAKVYDDYYDTRSKYAPPTLALNLDATASYLDSTTSPTTWTDSVGGVPFTLYGGVGYNSGNGGYLTFQAASGRYADSTTGPALTQWAVEVWHYWNGSNVGGLPCILSEKFTGGSINYALGSLDSGTVTNFLQAGCYGGPPTGSGGWLKTSPSYALPATNAWYHIVGTYNGIDDKLYVNGVCVSTTHTPSFNLASGQSGINLMKRWDGADYWGGRLSTVRIYDGEMGAAEVKLKFDATKSRFGL